MARRGTPLARILRVPVTAPVPIAIVMPAFDPGGTERQMIELVRRLDRRRWHVHVACFRRTGAWLDRVADAAPIAEFPVRSFGSPDILAQVMAFGRWCRDRRIAVVHTTDLPSNIFGLPAAALARVPVRIGNRREVNPGRTIAEIACQRAAYTCAHRIVANCHAAAEQLFAEQVPPRKVRVIHNGVERHARGPSARRTRPRRIVAVANLRREKGHDVLLHAAAVVMRTFPDSRFELVGGGPELPALRATADALGLEHAVSFLGHREDVKARLEAADIFVLPSRSEAFPNAVLEAMAAGLPVVASGVGGVLEIVRQGETGLIVPPGDAAVLASAICRLMGDPPFAHGLGDAARAEVTERYSFDRMIDGFEAIYLTELARCGHLPLPQPELAAS
jgi:glycosyltransferase involved in cell wall biosynthesis